MCELRLRSIVSISVIRRPWSYPECRDWRSARKRRRPRSRPLELANATPECHDTPEFQSQPACGLLMMNDPRPFGAYAPTGFAKWVLGLTRAFSSGWAPRRVAFMLRRLAVQALKGQPVDVVSLGARMRLYPYNNVCEKRILFTPQFFDPEELALLESRIVPGFTFVDVGANVGGYSLFVAARAGGSGRILALEPQPEIFDRLTYNIRQNPFGTIKAVACAVADKTGELTLFLDPNNRGE